MLDATPYLQRFIEELTKLNRGRAFFTTPETLGDYVLVDFLESRRQMSRRGSGRRGRGKAEEGANGKSQGQGGEFTGESQGERQGKDEVLAARSGTDCDRMMA